MKRCLPSGKPKDSLWVLASVQSQSLLALNSTTKTKPLCVSCLQSLPTCWLSWLAWYYWVGWLVLHWVYTHAIMSNYRVSYQQMHKKSSLQIISLTNGAVTQDMSPMPQEKQKQILSNYWVYNKIKY